MSKSALFVVAAATVALAPVSGNAQPVAALPPPGSADAAALEQRIDAYLAPLLDTNNFSGVIFAARGDRVVLNKGYGLASIEHSLRNGPDTVFHIASVSKPFTSAAIMLLQEDGKLDVRAPLRAILPDYPNGDKLTIHHLLSHTSGIPNVNDFSEYEEAQRRPHTPADLVELFRARPLEFEPGAKYSYSNSNYNLLALAIEKASGLAYGEFLEQRIFKPLGLSRTGHHGSAAQIVRNAALGYAPAGAVGLERAPYIDWSVKSGNGSLYSDAAGVARFVRAAHKAQLLAPASMSATFAPHTANAGYGWFLTKANGRALHHANGRSPGFAAQADYYPDDDVTVVVLANTYVSVTTDIARAVGAHLFGLPAKPMPALKAQPLPGSAIAALTGKYQFGPDYYVPNALVTVTAKAGQLEAMVDNYGPYSLVPITPTRFLMRSFWVPAEFALDERGRARQMAIDGIAGKRSDKPAAAAR